jgi:hypothetical protein
MMGLSPSQDLDSLVANSVGGQEITQKQQGKIDARIAATRAIANVSSTTKQKK